MRITDLKIDGFGVWSGLEISELSDQLNVFYGPNEAGKTTLMQFVRSVLYGFSPERRARYLPPLRPGRPGGSIQAVLGQKSYAISRHSDELGEAPIVSNSEITVQDEHALTSLLGEIDESIFNNVFAIGLREIQELGTLSDTQAADELYNLTLGLNRVSLVDVLRELETSRNRLLAADDRPSLVTQLLSQRERLQGEIADLGQATSRYLSLTAERRKLDGEIRRLETEDARWDQESRELALASALRERWMRRAAIGQQLATFGSFGTLPESALARLDSLEGRLAARSRRLRKLKDERQQLLDQIEKLNINEALCGQAMRLEALGEQQQWIKSLQTSVEQLENEVLELEAQRDQTFKQFGAGTNPTSGAGPVSQRSLAELRATAKALRQARGRVSELREQFAAGGQKASDQQRQIEAALGTAKDKGLTQALAEAGELVSQLRKRVQLDERLDQMSRRETELEEQSHEHLDQQILPGWIVIGLGGLFVMGCALVLLFVAGLVLPESMSGSLDWRLALVGAGAMGAAGLMKFVLEHAAARQLGTCHQQIQLLNQQIKQARTERDELDAKLPRGGGPLVARLQAAEKSLARLEELLPLESQRETAQQEANQSQQQAEALQAECDRLRKNWRRLLADAGLPRELAPRQLKDFCRGREEMRGLSRSLEEKSAALGRGRAEYDMLSGRIKQLVAEVGLDPANKQPLDQLQQCLIELRDQQTRLKRRDELTRQLARLRRRRIKVSHGMDQLRQRRRSLLQLAGADDEQDFRRRAHTQAEAQRLEAERAQIAHEIAAAVAGRCSEETIGQWLADPNLTGREAQLADTRRIANEQLTQAVEKRGEMNAQLKAIVEDRQLPHKRIELSIVEKRLQDALERWRVLTICGMLLSAVREYYEREHQPPALREASGYLRRLTSGRYTRVWTPLGEHSLRVDDSDGVSLRVDVLSRGTREQLFLALRLALISSYARRGVQLPLVLDDVLVNFDVGRAKAAALVLRDFAKQGHQILIFTCHEHISKLFKQIKAEVRQLPDNALLQSISPADANAKRVRRSRPETLPEPEPEMEPEIESEIEPVFEPDLEDLPTHREPAVEAPQPVLAEVLPPRAEIIVEIRPPVQPPPARTVRADPPEPPPRPVRQVRRQPVRRTERVNWSAEEFEGELADRVRRTEDSDETPSDADDAEAA